MLPKVTTIQGHPVQLGDRIGGGGEGDVYRVIGHPPLVAKIWHPQKRVDEQIAKISRMCRIDTNLHIKGNPVLAWPQEPILEMGSVVGYTMPMVVDHFTLYDCLTPARSRNKNLPIQASDRPLLASRIANIFNALHGNNCFVGDINPQNILIQRGSLVPILIDCDSFQINDSEFPDSPFLSSVVTPEYRAPERTQPDTPIDGSMDVFGLAVIVYQLLLLGEHPYSGIDNLPHIDHMPTLVGRIADGRFAHARGAHWHPRTNEVKQAWEALPEAVRNVLTQALDYQQFGCSRPTAKQLNEVIRAHQTPLITILERFSRHRSSSKTTASRKTQTPNRSRNSATRTTRPHTTYKPMANDSDDSGSTADTVVGCLVLIALIVTFIVIANIFDLI